MAGAFYWKGTTSRICRCTRGCCVGCRAPSRSISSTQTSRRSRPSAWRCRSGSAAVATGGAGWARLTATLPYGKQRLLEIAVAIAAKPRVLLLDEPAAGVPESERHGILAAVAALPRDVTVLLIEHDMDLVFSFADRISVLVNGAMLVEGPPDEVARDPQVKAVYLGEAADA